MKQHRLRHLAAALLSVTMTAQMLTALPAHAGEESELIGYRGDINGDRTVNLEDVLLMQSWLFGTPQEPWNSYRRYAWEYADMDKNGTLDVRDLTLMKRMILEEGFMEPIYEETEPETEKTLIPAPVSAVSPSLPSTGTVRIPLFAVEFPDCKFDSGSDEQQIVEISFGPEDRFDDRSWAYPLESITAFYERASYHRLHIEGDVFKYTAKNALSSYTGHTNQLVGEILSALDDRIDYRQYDANGDKTMDALIIALPGAALEQDSDGNGSADWWPYSIAYSGWNRFDGIYPGKVTAGGWALSDIPGFTSTWIHELGHAMGLPDYYKYENNSDSYFGLNGNAGWEMMDDSLGDFSAFSKLMYGWLAEDEVLIYTGGTQEFTLTSMQQKPVCIVIPRTDEAGFLKEFFIIEYITPEGNYTRAFQWNQTSSFRMIGSPGVRILHCDAHVSQGQRGMEFSYSNRGLHYDSSNLKQRVLRLINEAEGGNLLKKTEVTAEAFSGFRWYDSDGYQTVDPGITVSIGEIMPGPMFYWDDSDSSLPDTSLPDYMHKSTVTIRISENQ